MKVHAIRLAECARFRAPVALENLSGGLDVVIGRNELGKSTILRALRLALTEKHTSANAMVKSMRPYAGGAPLIEVELEIDGARWRLRKRYLAQRTAELARLDGNEIFRGEDAEARLVDLMDGPSGGGRFPLLWLSQGESLNPLTIDKSARDRVTTAIRSEVETIAAGDSTALFLERVEAKLGEVQTAHGTPRSRGRYEAALRRKRDLTEALQSAKARVHLTAEHLDRLEAIRRREAALADPHVAAALARDIATARAELEMGREAASRAAEARQAASAAEQRCKAAIRDLDEYDRTLASFAAVTTALAADEAEAARIASELAGLVTEVERARQESATREALVTDLDQRHAAALAGERHRAVSRALTKIERQLADAQGLTERRKLIARELATIAVTEARVLAVQRETNALAILDAQLAAAATTISVAYAQTAKARIHADGRPLDDGERIETLRPMTLDIEGVGRVTVTPAQAADLDDLHADREAHRGVRDELLAVCGVPDLQALQAALVHRQALEAEASRIEAQLTALAPSGVVALGAERMTLAAELARLPQPVASATSHSPADLEADLRAARSALEDWRSRLATALAHQSKLRETEAALRARTEERRRQVSALEQRLPLATERAKQTVELTASRDAAVAAMNDAVRTLQAWQEKAPDAVRVSAMQATLAAAEKAHATHTGEVARIAAEVARIEGELSVLRNEDAATLADALAGELAAVTEETARIEDEIAALRLLQRELTVEREALTTQFLAPVNARLAPYLQLVLPGAELGFDAGYAPTHLARGEIQEPLDRLSDGTREQIAVLARLAFARLLAEAGQPVPLILDDALVYADDERIAGMFEALKTASQAHQVLVLSCRSRAFEGLGGRRIALTPWQPS